MRQRAALILVIVGFSTAAVAGPLDDLEPGHWVAAPSSELAPHMPPREDVDWSGPAGLMAAWSGGAYDTQRDRLIIWGGGHQDYAGNELYVFDVVTLAWTRLTERSADVGGDEASGYYPDGTPRSRHTYEYIEYLPAPFDRFCSFGGAALFPSGQVGIANVDCFDFETLTWERRADSPSSSIGAVAAVDPVTGHTWVQGAGNSLPLAEYDPALDTWTSHVREPSGWFTYSHTAAIDPVRRKFVAIGGGEVVVWDLENPDLEPVRLQTTGAKAIQDAGNPGVEYDPVSDKLVAYAGGVDVYTLDLDTATWLLHPVASSNLVTPPPAAATGTYGRFRYVASKNVFVTVAAIDQSVYFYKLAPGGGVVPVVEAVDSEDAQAEDSDVSADVTDTSSPDLEPEVDSSEPAARSSDDGCGCHTTRRTPTRSPLLLLGFLLSATCLGWLRRGPRL